MRSTNDTPQPAPAEATQNAGACPITGTTTDSSPGVDGTRTESIRRLSPSKKWAEGRLSVVSSLREDPFWPTRRPIRAIRRTVNGKGRPGPLPPGPKGIPIVGSVIEMRREPYEFFRRNAAIYGDIYRVPMPLFDLVMVQHPDDVSAFMDDATGRYSMSASATPLVQRVLGYVGAAVPFLEGDKFRQRRRMLMPMFGRRHLARVADVLAAEFVTRMDSWSRWVDSGEVVDLQHAISQVTLPAFLRAMFSSSISEQEIHETDIDLRTMMGLVGSGTLLMAPPNLIPWPGRDSAPHSMRRVRALVRRLVQDRRSNPTETVDLLNLLLEARYDDGSALSEPDLEMELIVLMAGGYETVVASLSWTLAHLLSHHDHLETLYREIDALDGAVPTPEDLPRLTWAKACFDEGQRLQGAPINPRFVMEDSEIGGYPIPQYSMLAVSLYSVHRDPRWWPEPDRYDPTRFTDEAAAKTRPRLAFMPFGSGPHHCLGTGMAYMNAQFLLTILFQRYRLALPKGWAPQHQYAFSTIVKGGLPVTLTNA